MKAKVNTDLCIGCRVCESVSPYVFRMQGKKATVRMPDVIEKFQKSCRQAKEECPAQAIEIIE